MAGVTRGFEKRDWLLVAAATTLIVGYLELGHFSVESKAPWYDEKLAASRLAHDAMTAVKAEKRARGITIDPATDVNETGMIGLRWSGMTTTLGVLEAKRTSTQPDFAGVVVGLLKQCGAKRGDRVAVNLSGSFPALGLSVIILTARDATQEKVAALDTVPSDDELYKMAGQVMVDVTKATEPRKTTVIFKYTCNDDGEWSADDSVNSEMMDAMLS